MRVQKTENGVTTYAVRSSVLGGQVAAEVAYYGGGWNWWRSYVHLGSQLLAVQQDGVVRWVHEDPVTKTKRMTDAAGAVISTVVFDPWGGDVGGVWSQNTFQQRRRFTTYERDGNESDEAMMRRYNRWHSRFDQPDPYDGSYDVTNPQSFNRYAYVQNDPVNFTDPSGLDTCYQDPATGRTVCIPDINGGTVIIPFSPDSPMSHVLSSGGRSGGVRLPSPPYVVEPRDRGARDRDPIGPQRPPDPGPTLANVKRDMNEWRAAKLPDCLKQAAIDYQERKEHLNQRYHEDLLGYKSLAGLGYNLVRGGLQRNLAGFVVAVAIVDAYHIPKAIEAKRAYERAKANCHSLYNQR